MVVNNCSTNIILDIARDFAVNDDRIQVYNNENNPDNYPYLNKATSMLRKSI